eukprot:GHVU01227565.1.p1 GENE.GHVU01227565.1~~GHVU01227565.1.p1  ORF type:complete len:175 (-),score=22.44 GHVU01227565.1:423-947(-)
MKIQLTSDDVNVLVYRYLLENGFVHTCFSFFNESNVSKSPSLSNHAEKVPPNGLVSFLQKGLLYSWIEYHTDNTGDEIPCQETFSFFKKHECSQSKGGAADASMGDTGNDADDAHESPGPVGGGGAAGSSTAPSNATGPAGGRNARAKAKQQVGGGMVVGVAGRCLPVGGLLTS